jgi:hypothetical protein
MPSDDHARAFADAAAARGRQGAGLRPVTDNARAFWNWNFIPGDRPDLPQTRAMLMRACDVRLPARLQKPDLDFIADALIAAAEDVMGVETCAYGT